MSKLQEIWKFYKETYGPRYGKRVYYVSNLGNVKCNGILYVCFRHDGYYYLSHKPVHRIVAELFIPNPDSLPCVNHIDANRLNNRVDNLKWSTYKENSNNPISIQRQIKSSNKKAKTVLQYTKDNKLVNEFISIREAERETKIPYVSIINCCKHKYKTAGGYIWKYKKED